jgi:hypothetical protein
MCGDLVCNPKQAKNTQGIESKPCAKRKDLIARKHYQVKSQLNGNLQMKPQLKGISVAILIPSGIVFEATARVAPEKQTESLPADALSHDS